MPGTESAFGPKNPLIKEEARRIQASSLSPVMLVIGIGASFPQRSPEVEECRAWIPTESEAWLRQLRQRLETTKHGLSEAATPADEFEAWLQRHRSAFAIGNLITTRHGLSEAVTPVAEQFAKKLGIYGALVLTKEIVREQMSSAMTALHVDRKDDPDESGLTTICFIITTRESVDSMLQRDNDLQEALISRVPANACLHFSFAYQFE